MSANPLTSTLAALLESAASAALALDSDARDQLLPLEGQTLLLELETLPNLPSLNIRVSIHGENGPANRAGDGGSLTIMADSTHNLSPPNAIVRGSVTDLMATLGRDELPPGMSIEGDERLLMSLKRCFQELSPDWRERLDDIISRFTGSGFASGAGSSAGARAGSQMFQDVLGQAELAFDTLRTTLGQAFDNTREQASSTTDKFWAKDSDLDSFATRLENLQLSVDRLSAQVQHLKVQSSEKTSAQSQDDAPLV